MREGGGWHHDLLATVPELRGDRILLSAHADNEAAVHAAGEDEETARRFGWWPARSTEETVLAAYANWARNWREARASNPDSPTRAHDREMADSRPSDDQASDASRWWRSYVLADHGQVDELRSLAAAGDEHARRHLATCLSDRGRTGDAIDVIRPLADAGDEVAERWLAGWLADDDHLGELRQRAARGSWQAERELATLLARHDLYDELRERASPGGSHHALHELAKRLAERDLHDALRELAASADPERRLLILEAAGENASGGLDVLRMLADLGDKKGQARLAHRLACGGHLDELRHRAESGDEYAQHWLDEAPS